MHQVGIASAKLEQKLNRLPNSKEIANELGIPENHVTHSMKVGNRHSSLDAPLNKDGTVTFFDFLHDKKGEKPDEFALNKSQTQKIIDLLKVLPERQQLVMRLYFGIEEDTGYTLDEIGGQLSLTRERIRQIKDAALSRLKRSVLRHQFSDYVE
jgi:RNA polymerase primary sigma factor